MKKFVILSFFISCSLTLVGQTDNVRIDIDSYRLALQIQDDQQDKLTSIIQKKYNDLASIADLEELDEGKFRQKRRVIYRLAENSVRMILKEDQLELWSRYNKEKRAKNAVIIQELKAQNASKEDLKDAQYGIMNQ